MKKGRIARPAQEHHRFHPASAPDYLPARQLRDLQLARLQAIVAREMSKP